MDYRAIIALSLRLTGVIILIHTVPYAPQSFFSLATMTTYREAMLLTAMAQLIPILVGFALVYFPGRIGELLISTPAPQEQSAFTERLGEVAFLAVGIYLFASGILDGAYLAAKYWLYTVMVEKQEWESASSILQEDFAILISAVLQCLVGFLMAFTARGLYGFVRAMRETKPKA